ncbi:hypothetical protein BH23VER1_BH23VER1_05920 [soil metagenome]
MLAFSTCWNSSRHSDGETLVDEILGLGFDTIEVSHGLKVSLLPGIQAAHAAGKVRIAGVHNFCPSPVELMIDAPDAYEFTSHRAYDRERALSLTFRTIEMASQLDAKYVVLHMGSVPIPRFTHDLEDLVADGKLHSREFVALKLKAIQNREKKAALYLRRAREALGQIAECAAEHQVKVAVESRSHYEQVPSEREMGALLDSVAPSPWVGYWHDFGHVQRKANLSLLDHAQWLRKMAPRLVGCHLHDVIWPDRDHRVPFQGTVDFDTLIPILPIGCPVVWEISPSRRSRDIAAALVRWRQEFPTTLAEAA